MGTQRATRLIPLQKPPAQRMSGTISGILKVRILVFESTDPGILEANSGILKVSGTNSGILKVNSGILKWLQRHAKSQM